MTYEIISGWCYDIYCVDYFGFGPNEEGCCNDSAMMILDPLDWETDFDYTHYIEGERLCQYVDTHDEEEW